MFGQLESRYDTVDGSHPPPRRHVWLGRLGIASVLLVCGVLALYSAFARSVVGANRGSHLTTGDLRAGRSRAGAIQMSGIFDKQSDHPINKFDEHLDSVKFEGAGLYYEFMTKFGHKVFSGQVEGKPGDWSDAKTPLPMASASKLFTGMAAMVTMQLKPNDFYPEKYVNEFKFNSWPNFSNFSIHGTSERANITIHELLTHTSGLPFAMRSSLEDIMKTKLFFKPGTGFGYTLGHRVAGWLIRDFWQQQPEAKTHNFATVNDAFKFLVFDRLGLSKDTKFDDSMKTAFGYSGQAGDASIQSTGEDLMKMAVVALRKGQLLNGNQLISETNWDKWAMLNLLPGGKLSKDLVSWQTEGSSWADWNVGGLKSSIMKQSGDYGWNYFGATYYPNDRVENGWCGFFSSCLRVSYSQSIAFVMMQRDVSDMKKSKPYMVEHFDELAKSLQCTENVQAHCPAAPALPVGSCCLGGSSCNKCPFGYHAETTVCPKAGDLMCSDVRCETCTEAGWFSKKTSCVNVALTPACPSNATRAKMVTYDYNMDDLEHSCYVVPPNCSSTR